MEQRETEGDRAARLKEEVRNRLDRAKGLLSPRESERGADEKLSAKKGGRAPWASPSRRALESPSERKGRIDSEVRERVLRELNSPTMKCPGKKLEFPSLVGTESDEAASCPSDPSGPNGSECSKEYLRERDQAPSTPAPPVPPPTAASPKGEDKVAPAEPSPSPERKWAFGSPLEGALKDQFEVRLKSIGCLPCCKRPSLALDFVLPRFFLSLSTDQQRGP